MSSPYRSPLPWIGACLAAAGLGLMAWTAPASAQHDPALPVHIVVGPPPGAHPMARTDPARTARTAELPSQPREIWNRGVRGGIEQVPAVDDHGNVILATSTGELAQLGPDGTEQWRIGLGQQKSAATVSPVILSDGTRLVLNAMGEAWGVSPSGAKRFSESHGAAGRDSRVALLPRDDGSAVAAVWGRLIVIGSDGKVRDHAQIGEAIVGALIGTRDGIVATSDSGAVWLWAPPLSPRRIGSFQGSVREGVALADDRTLIAVVDRRRLVAMDRRTGALTTREVLAGMEGPPAIGSGGTAFVATMGGVLVGMGAAAEVLRVALSPQPAAGDDAGVVSYRSSPPVIVDRAGRVAFVRADGKVGVVAPDGAISAAQGMACYDPMGIVPAGPKRFLVACRAGTIRMYE